MDILKDLSIIVDEEISITTTASFWMHWQSNYHPEKMHLFWTPYQLKFVALSEPKGQEFVIIIWILPPYFGHCAAQKTTYFGYKLYVTCSVTGVFNQITLSKAHVADIHYLQDIRDDFKTASLLETKDI